MVIEASKVNSCGIYCVDCPRKSLTTKSLTTEETTMIVNNKEYCPDISVHCEHANFCRFLIERVHTTDSAQGIFGGDKRE